MICNRKCDGMGLSRGGRRWPRLTLSRVSTTEGSDVRLAPPDNRDERDENAALCFHCQA